MILSRKNKVAKILVFLTGIFLLISCNKSASDLPYIGVPAQDKTGKTIQHKIADFAFQNQDDKLINSATVKGKVYVADFFFTSCPTICPTMKTQLLRVYEKYKTNNNFAILSHTIDPEHDSLAVLKGYKERLIGDAPNWHFLRAEKMYTHTLAQKQYFVSAMEDKTAIADGGFVHSGAFVLIDKNGHIRGVYDGTKEKEVDKLMSDIDLLF